MIQLAFVYMELPAGTGGKWYILCLSASSETRVNLCHFVVLTLE